MNLLEVKGMLVDLKNKRDAYTKARNIFIEAQVLNEDNEMANLQRHLFYEINSLDAQIRIIENRVIEVESSIEIELE